MKRVSKTTTREYEFDLQEKEISFEEWWLSYIRTKPLGYAETIARAAWTAALNSKASIPKLRTETVEEVEETDDQPIYQYKFGVDLANGQSSGVNPNANQSTTICAGGTLNE